ncbi:MAG: hypothetical protein OEY85_07510, partial [Rhodospirillales bacterium]|nr:hypothetical protein [Rhodospirillales bacterium]
AIAGIDPGWIEQLRRLVGEGLCEFIGSGYAQLIGPLVPPAVNAANLRLGHEVYERLLGIRPRIALVNEQAYSPGLVPHYRDADYKAVLMDWANPSSRHPEWPGEWLYLPQRAEGTGGSSIGLIWSDSVPFQKFQRYAHGESELEDHIAYLAGFASEERRAFPLYANDVEIFDFRPGRFKTESKLESAHEWNRIRALFDALGKDHRFRIVPPSAVLTLMDTSGAGNLLRLQSAQDPIPVKKQPKYNISRWAVTGRDDLAINTACWRIHDVLAALPHAPEEDWRELCYLWSSDFRTHITDRRWRDYCGRLKAMEQKITGAAKPEINKNAHPVKVRITEDGPLLTVDTSSMFLRLNSRRGLAIDGFGKQGGENLIGTLPHGYFHDIAWAADFYSGHLVAELAGRPKVTDLEKVVPEVCSTANEEIQKISATIETSLGPVLKCYTFHDDGAGFNLMYRLDWSELVNGTLRLGFITLNPGAFDRNTLFFRSHNGGLDLEACSLGEDDIDHGGSLSFLNSVKSGLGMTEGILEMGDARTVLRLQCVRGQASPLALIACKTVDDTYFCRAGLSLREMDDTCAAGNRYQPADENMPLELTLSVRVLEV